VLIQDPAANAQAAPGTAVTLTVGSAPDAVTVPDVTQFTTYDAAKNALTDLNLKVQKQEVNNKATPGTPLNTNPPAGSSVAPGTVVTIRVSTGRSGMPDVVGKNADDAKVLLTQQGIPLGNIKTQEMPPDTDFDPGLVWKTDPAAGAVIGPEDTITLFVVPPKPTGAPSSSSPSGSGSAPPSSGSPPPSSGGNGAPGGVGGIGDRPRQR
jgi:serine/threonine-protein kinase